MLRDIGFKERRYIEELRILTRSTAIDCIIDESFGRIIYVIRKGDMGLAIGRKGDNIRRLEKVLGKRIEMVEESENAEVFLCNILKPSTVTRVSYDPDEKEYTVYVSRKSDLAVAIGKGGATIEKARVLMKRFFGSGVGTIVMEEMSDAE